MRSSFCFLAIGFLDAQQKAASGGQHERHRVTPEGSKDIRLDERIGYLPIEEIVETLILRDVRLLQLVQADTVCFNERRDRLDGLRRVIDLPLLC